MTAAGFVAVGTVSVTAKADSVDYGSLEQMFGEPVTTSATGKPQRASDVPMAMIIITADQIRRAAAIDLPGILKEYTDLDVLQFTRGSSDVSVRGYDTAMEPRLLVLVNGRQVYVDYFGFTNWDAIPVELAEIRQIEVVKGPNSALFGFNAAAGVVNIITMNPLYDSVNEASARIGTQGDKELSAVGTAHVGDSLGVRLSAGGYNAQPFNDTLTNLLTAPLTQNPFRRAVNLDVRGQINDDLQVGFEASHSLVAQNQWMLSYLARPNQLRSDSLKANFSANSGIGLIDGEVYKNFVFTNYSMIDSVPGMVEDLAVGDQLSTRESVTSAKLQDLFKIGADHTLRLAGEYRYNTMNSVPIEDVQAGYTVYSGSGLWDWAITPEIDLNNALRFDHLQLERSGPSSNGPSPITNTIPSPALNAMTDAALANALVSSNPVTWPYTNANFNSKNINEVSANSGLVIKASEFDTIRLSYGRGIQMPPLVDYAWYEPILRTVPLGGGATAQIPALVNGNPSLEPTIVTNYELGYTRDLSHLSSKLSTSVFYDTYENLSSTDPFTHRAITGNQTLLESENIGNSHSIGLEVGLDGHTDSWRWGFNYRLESIHDKLNFSQYDSNGNLVVDLLYQGSSPSHLLTLRGGYSYKSWDFDLFGRYSSSFSLPNPNPQFGIYGLMGGTFNKYTIPAYVTIDARIAYNLTDKLSVAINLVNFQSKSTPFSNAPPVERQGYLTLGIKF